MKKNIYQSPQIKILVLSGRKLMDDWVVGGTVVGVQGAKRNRISMRTNNGMTVTIIMFGTIKPSDYHL